MRFDCDTWAALVDPDEGAYSSDEDAPSIDALITDDEGVDLVFSGDWSVWETLSPAEQLQWAADCENE